MSAIAENIVALQIAALRSENHRLMTIMKSRDRRTDMRIRRFEIAAGGIQIDSDPHERRNDPERPVQPGTVPPRDLNAVGA